MLFQPILALIGRTPALGALCAAAMLLPSAPAHSQAGDDKILEMHQAQRKGDRARLSALLPQVRGHALEPWAAYWELRARLDSATQTELNEFFTRYAGTYQEDRLRNDLLLLLGQRRDWTRFEAEYPKFRMNDDREVRCYAILAQHTRNESLTTPALVDEVRRNWLGQRERDDGCTAAAAALYDAKGRAGRLGSNDIWRKARMAMEAGRTRAATEAVEIVAPRVVSLVAEAASSPTKILTRRGGTTVRNEIAGLALIKLAATDPFGAAHLLETKWHSEIVDEEANWVWGVIGKQAALKLSADAAEFFSRVARDNDLNDDLLGWKVRAALRAEKRPKWDMVLSATEAMSEDGRKDPTWAYWRGRALIASRDEAQRAKGREVLAGIASIRGFYELLAMEELGQKPSLPSKPAALSPEEIEAARLNAGLNRAVYAITIGLRPEGVREWNYSTNLAKPGGMSERELLAAAQFACDREVWDRCINTSERTRQAFDADQRFPMPFRDAVVARSKAIGLDPAYVYGLIRQESRFIMDARSHVGASGLMQVMPRTAAWTAKKIGLDGFKPEQITDRDTNIAIGTGYLKLVLDDFQGSQALAAAAYNAGPGRPRNWRAPGGRGPVLEGAAWAENIPFNETRDYVKKVVANSVVYAMILGTQPQSAKARMGQVGPREGAAPSPNTDLP